MGRASGAVNRAPMDPENDWTLLTWLRNNRWIVLIVGIIFISCVISIIMICVCRTQLSRGLSKRFSKSFAVKRKYTGTQNGASYENSIYRISEHVPLPPHRHVMEVEDASYSYVQNERFAEVEGYLQETTRPSSSGYIDVVPEDGDSIYDDAIIPPSLFHNGVVPCP